MRRRVKRVPDTAQASLAFAGPGAEGPERSVRKVRFGATQFVEPTPWHLYVGQERVDEYLTRRGLGWVVRMREELQKVDFSSLELNYLGSGRPAYHPRLMMGLIVYAVLQQRWSLRAIEELAIADIGAWWLCGGQQPDHSTIGEFLVRHREQITKEFFDDLVHGLVRRKGINNGVAAGDGTVIEAAASRFALLSQEAAEQAATKLRGRAQQQPDNEELGQRAQQAEEVASTARERAQERARKGGKKDGALVSPIEPQAVMQRCKDGRHRPSYKPCVLAHQSGLIVSQSVEPSNESASMIGLVDRYKKAFGADPLTVLIDAGFHNIELLSEMAERQIDVICPAGTTLEGQWERKGQKGKFAKSEFKYDPQGDRYLCPAAQWMMPSKPYRHVNTGLQARKYRTKHCARCELRTQCTQSQQGRQIVRLEGEEIKEMMRMVLAQPRAQERYGLRREIVERIFAELGWRQGLRRFHRYGLDGSRLEFSLHCVAFNLKWATRRELFVAISGSRRHLWLVWRLSITQGRGQAFPSAKNWGEDFQISVAA